MNKNRKTLKMPVRYLMNAVLVVLLFLALSYMTGNMLSTYQNKVLMTVGINIILAVSRSLTRCFATQNIGEVARSDGGVNKKQQPERFVLLAVEKNEPRIKLRHHRYST